MNFFTLSIVFLYYFLNVLSKHVLWQVLCMIVLSIQSLTIYDYPNEEVNLDYYFFVGRINYCGICELGLSK